MQLDQEERAVTFSSGTSNDSDKTSRNPRQRSPLETTEVLANSLKSCDSICSAETSF